MCKFCAELNKARFIFRKEKHDFKCSLYTQNYTLGVLTGNTISKPFDLNYCPECGKRINHRR